MRSVGVLLFDDVELLDFAGPLEVFTAANYIKDNNLLDVETVGLTNRIKVSKSNLDIKPDKVISEDLKYDLFIIPGGFGTRPIIKNDAVLKTIKSVIDNSERTATVCTGSLILAKLGYLRNKNATSHHLALDVLQKQDDTINIHSDKRFIDLGPFITSAGVSAGIDMSFYILEKEFGKDISKKTAKYIEYLGVHN
jgi:transcriptional regulator GlxA family with amidase domain